MAGRCPWPDKGHDKEHGQLIARMMADMGFEGGMFPGRLQKGFQIAGHLDGDVHG